MVRAERAGRSGLNDRLRHQENARWHREIHGVGCSEVNGQLEACRPFDGNLRRVAPAEDLIHLPRRTSMQIRQVRAEPHEPPGLYKIDGRRDGWKTAPREL